MRGQTTFMANSASVATPPADSRVSALVQWRHTIAVCGVAVTTLLR